MDALTNAYMAPFSSEKAELTTPAKIAVVYGLTGLLVGMLFLGK